MKRVSQKLPTGATHRVIIEWVPYKNMRVPGQVGDWLTDKDGSDRYFVASELGFDSGLAVALHEIVEKHECDNDGVSCAVVDRWDVECKDEDPWLNKKAPYHKQHMMADRFERFFCKLICLSWKQHEATQDKVVQ
jgi:hypothetical protein